jgi:hypothetical protein
MQDAITRSCYREVQDLYHAWLQSNDAADNSLDQHSPNDKNLRAIAQLAVLKLRAQHAVISLVDDKSQYILAQASNTLSPSHGSASASNELLSGFTSQPLSEAFYDPQFFADSTSHSGRSFSHGPDHFVSADCRTDDRFKDHAFVRQEEGVRSALGVPLISKSKHKVGVLLVLDRSPRDGVEDTDLLELKNCAECVVRHLCTLPSEPQKRPTFCAALPNAFQTSTSHRKTIPNTERARHLHGRKAISMGALSSLKMRVMPISVAARNRSKLPSKQRVIV